MWDVVGKVCFVYSNHDNMVLSQLISEDRNGVFCQNISFPVFLYTPNSFLKGA